MYQSNLKLQKWRYFWQTLFAMPLMLYFGYRGYIPDIFVGWVIGLINIALLHFFIFFIFLDTTSEVDTKKTLLLFNLCVIIRLFLISGCFLFVFMAMEMRVLPVVFVFIAMQVANFMLLFTRKKKTY